MDHVVEGWWLDKAAALATSYSSVPPTSTLEHDGRLVLASASAPALVLRPVEQYESLMVLRWVKSVNQGGIRRRSHEGFPVLFEPLTG